jgi:hypothetical protein
MGEGILHSPNVGIVKSYVTREPSKRFIFYFTPQKYASGYSISYGKNKRKGKNHEESGMRSEEFSGRRIWAHFLRQCRKKPGCGTLPAFHCSNSSARLRRACGISAAIQVAWASNDFASQNRDQPLARPRGFPVVEQDLTRMRVQPPGSGID